MPIPLRSFVLTGRSSIKSVLSHCCARIAWICASSSWVQAKCCAARCCSSVTGAPVNAPTPAMIFSTANESGCLGRDWRVVIWSAVEPTPRKRHRTRLDGKASVVCPLQIVGLFQPHAAPRHSKDAREVTASGMRNDAVAKPSLGRSYFSCSED
jgi:hypothetical protein